MPMPADANQNGDIFGGWIMAQVDIAGGTMAGRTARGRVATVAVKEFVFKQPVQVGDLLSFYVDLVRTGRTSITVNVEVYAERRPSDPEVVKVTEATLTYVAIDRDGGDAAAREAAGGGAARDVDLRHDPAAEDVAVLVRIRGHRHHPQRRDFALRESVGHASLYSEAARRGTGRNPCRR